MRYEVRITVHEKGTQKPNYDDVHQRMQSAGYMRELYVGGYALHQLHGMYQKLTLQPIDAERSIIKQALQSMGFRFSIELFHITETRTFDLEPVTDYGSLLNMLGGR